MSAAEYFSLVAIISIAPKLTPVAAWSMWAIFIVCTIVVKFGAAA